MRSQSCRTIRSAFDRLQWPAHLICILNFETPTRLSRKDGPKSAPGRIVMPLSVVEKREPRTGFSRRIPCGDARVAMRACVGRIRYFKSVIVGYPSVMVLFGSA